MKDSTGNALGDPWTGGLNFCQFSRIDADRDGKKDLLVFDRSGDKVEIFLNRNGDWKHSEAYDEAFPSLQDWVLARDFDNDGDRDLFASENGGLGLHENKGGNQLAFEKLSSQLLSDHYPWDNSTGPINIYVQNSDIPAIDDIDGDGDLDILNFHILGTQVEYHRNMALEQNGNTDTLIFERRNACWGFFSEGGSSSSITLDDSCSSNVQNPEGAAQHSGSTLLSLDMNGDGVKELMLGDVGSNELTLLENGGAPTASHMDNVITPFPTGGDAVDLAIFPAPFHVDVDRDSVRDLLVSPNKGATSVNRKSIWYYRNTGSDSVPSFDLQKKNFLQDSTLDLGEGAFPVFQDIDKDGDEDLFVGNQELQNSSGSQPSSIAFIENIGSSSSPSFRVRTKDYQNFSQVGMGKALYPSFGDLDGDGDPDLLIGDSDGYLHYFENISPVGDPASYSLSQPQYPDDQGQAIDIGQFAAPSLIDLDRDGLLDLAIGEKGGNLVHYENVGTSSTPSFAHRTDSLGEVLVTVQGGFEGYSIPRFFEDSGNYELVVGSKSGQLHYYKGIENNLSGSFQKVTAFFGGIDDGKRSAPALAELTGDQRPDMIVGDYGGGLAFYRGGQVVQDLATPESEAKIDRLWPNPVRSGKAIKIRLTGQSIQKSTLRLYDLKGRTRPIERVHRENGRLVIELPDLPAGLYFISPGPSKNAHGFVVR